MLQKLRSPAPNSSGGGSGSLGYKFASWVSSGIFTAFFVSLDRCSCIKLDTMDIYEPVPEQSLLFRSHRQQCSSTNVPNSIAPSSSSSAEKRSAAKSRNFPQKTFEEEEEDIEEEREAT